MRKIGKLLQKEVIFLLMMPVIAFSSDVQEELIPFTHN